MTSPSATQEVRPAGKVCDGPKGGASPLRHWSWALLTVALVGLLTVGWSATGWFPENAGACTDPECVSTARTQISLHWVAILALGVLAAGSLIAGVRGRPGDAPEEPARLSPLWHGVVIGITVMLLATITLWPTVRIGMLSPPLGVGALAVELVGLALLLDRMHRSARPASSPRRRLHQALVVATCVAVLEVALPLVSPFRALSAGMLMIALVQAGVALVLTTWFALRDRASHGDTVGERRTAALTLTVVALTVAVIAIVGLNLSWASAGRFGEDLLTLVHPW